MVDKTAMHAFCRNHIYAVSNFILDPAEAFHLSVDLNSGGI